MFSAWLRISLLSSQLTVAILDVHTHNNSRKKNLFQLKSLQSLLQGSLFPSLCYNDNGTRICVLLYVKRSIETEQQRQPQRKRRVQNLYFDFQKMAAAAAASSSVIGVERKNLVTYVGNRVKVTLDDDSVLTGRLVSLSASGSLVLTDVERQRVLKRRRSRDGVHETTRECYAAVLFVRGGCVVSVGYDSGITTDKSVVDHIGGREAKSSRMVQMANAAPSSTRARKGM